MLVPARWREIGAAWVAALAFALATPAHAAEPDAASCQLGAPTADTVTFWQPRSGEEGRFACPVQRANSAYVYSREDLASKRVLVCRRRWLCAAFVVDLIVDGQRFVAMASDLEAAGPTLGEEARRVSPPIPLVAATCAPTTPRPGGLDFYPMAGPLAPDAAVHMPERLGAGEQLCLTHRVGGMVVARRGGEIGLVWASAVADPAPAVAMDYFSGGKSFCFTEQRPGRTARPALARLDPTAYESAPEAILVRGVSLTLVGAQVGPDGASIWYRAHGDFGWAWLAADAVQPADALSMEIPFFQVVTDCPEHAVTYRTSCPVELRAASGVSQRAPPIRIPSGVELLGRPDVGRDAVSYLGLLARATPARCLAPGEQREWRFGDDRLHTVPSARSSDSARALKTLDVVRFTGGLQVSEGAVDLAKAAKLRGISSAMRAYPDALGHGTARLADVAWMSQQSTDRALLRAFVGGAAAAIGPLEAAVRQVHAKTERARRVEAAALRKIRPRLGDSSWRPGGAYRAPNPSKCLRCWLSPCTSAREWLDATRACATADMALPAREAALHAAADDASAIDAVELYDWAVERIGAHPDAARWLGPRCLASEAPASTASCWHAARSFADRPVLPPEPTGSQMQGDCVPVPSAAAPLDSPPSAATYLAPLATRQDTTSAMEMLVGSWFASGCHLAEAGQHYVRSLDLTVITAFDDAATLARIGSSLARLALASDDLHLAQYLLERLSDPELRDNLDLAFNLAQSRDDLRGELALVQQLDSAFGMRGAKSRTLVAALGALDWTCHAQRAKGVRLSIEMLNQRFSTLADKLDEIAASPQSSVKIARRVERVVDLTRLEGLGSPGDAALDLPVFACRAAARVEAEATLVRAWLDKLGAADRPKVDGWHTRAGEMASQACRDDLALLSGDLRRSLAEVATLVATADVDRNALQERGLAQVERLRWALRREQAAQFDADAATLRGPERQAWLRMWGSLVPPFSASDLKTAEARAVLTEGRPGGVLAACDLDWPAVPTDDAVVRVQGLIQSAARCLAEARRLKWTPWQQERLMSYLPVLTRLRPDEVVRHFGEASPEIRKRLLRETLERREGGQVSACIWQRPGMDFGEESGP